MRHTIKSFIQHETAGGIVLMLAAALAICIANSPLADLYQYILDLPVGIGVTLDDFLIGLRKPLILWINDAPGADTIPLGVTRQTLSNEFGVALQAGIDVPVGANTLISLDAKKYWVDTTARWYAGDTRVIETTHAINPWVLSAGVGFRF